MAKTDTKNAVAVVEEKSTALVSAAALDLMMADAGQDHFDVQDVAIPFFAVLQALSPQVNKRDGEYVEGAEPGMFYNSATGEIYDGEEGIIVIPVMYQRRYTEWWPRDSKQGKGLVQDFGTDESCLELRKAKDENGKWITPEGTEIVISATFYVILIDEETSAVLGRGIVSLQGSQFKKGKKWNALITGFQMRRPDGKGFFTPAMYARTYKLVTVPESNDQGNWFGVKVSPHKNTMDLEDGESLYLLAKEFRAQIDSGAVRAAPPPGADGGAGRVDANGGDSEDIPF